MKDTLTSTNYSLSQRKICEVDVAVPTLILEPFSKGGEPEIFVQWFAEFSPATPMKFKSWVALVEKFRQMQFRFPVLISPKDECWMGHPELFKVVLLGQVQDLSGKVVVSDPGNDDDWALWVVSSHYGRKIQGREIPASFVISLKVMLGHHAYGLITPKKYYDAAVFDREQKAFEQQGRLWSLKCMGRLN
ncbi:MAG: hypothetical protein ACYC75_01400 [Minisyncoccota bacterium]